MRRLLLALAVALALTMQPIEAPVTLAGPCGDDVCLGLFDQLRSDITNPVLNLVPAPLQGSLLVKADLAERSSPTDPCRSLNHLAALTNEVNGLQRAQRISLFAANTLASDVSAIVAVLSPVNPC